ncbi:MAG: hypothetical protein DRI57_20245 [Deltaproteobacteria bacterium]|nr:MAG: hypothetical protein DRI57_20245 [Deltaproteobacteria bacterium]
MTPRLLRGVRIIFTDSAWDQELQRGDLFSTSHISSDSARMSGHTSFNNFNMLQALCFMRSKKGFRIPTARERDRIATG